MKIQRLTCYGGILAAASVALTAATAFGADYETTVLSDTPLAFYPLNLQVDTNTSSGGQYIATDLSGNGNNGTYVNIAPGFNNATGPSAYITNAVNFNGASTFVDLSTGSNPTLLNFGGPITMEGWAQPANSTEVPADIIGKGYDSSMNDDELETRANGGNYQGGTYSDSHGGQGASGGSQTANVWAYVVCTYDGTDWNLYYNGALQQKNADSVGAIDFPDTWAIGDGTASGAGRYFNGNLTEVALYNYALTPAQVYSHYFAGQYGTTPDASIPIITSQPSPESAYPGGSATFTVGVLSALPTTNQWFFNSVAVAGQTNTSFTVTNVQSGSVGNYSVLIGNSNGTTNSIAVPLTLLTVGDILQWAANNNSGTWDTGSSANWIDLATSQQVTFADGDQALFDDTAGVPTNVTLSGTVSPSILTVDSSSNDFTFIGSGNIAGPGSLIKEGTSSLSFQASDNLTGSVTIGAGTIVAGDYAFNSASSVTISNGGTLDFGGSPLTDNKPITVSGAGAHGVGAIYNSGGAQYGQILDITMTGDTSYGDTGNTRWDLGNGSSVTGPYNVTINGTDGSGYTEWDTVAIAPEVANFEVTNGSWGVKGLGNDIGNPADTITADPGAQLIFWNSNVGTNSGYSKNIHVLSNAVFAVRTSPNTYFNANVTLENTAQWDYFNGGGIGQTMNGTYTLNGIAHMLTGDSPTIFTNVISGIGGFVWDAYNNTVTFEASNTYSGPTVIGSGLTLFLTGNGSISQSSLLFFGGDNATSTAIDATGRPDQTLTLASGQTLGGVGFINGSLVVSPGASIAPAGTNVIIGMTEGSNPTGSLAASGNVTLQGTTTLKLNGSTLNDAVESSGGGITYGGTLNLVNISGAPYQNGDTFTIFSANSYAGSFASITPSTPGSGLAWNLNSSGVLSVVAGATQPVVSHVAESNGQLVFSGTNGTADSSFFVLSTTNLLTPVGQWTVVSTNSYDANGAFNITNSINTNTPAQFFLIESE